MLFSTDGGSVRASKVLVMAVALGLGLSSCGSGQPSAGPPTGVGGSLFVRGTLTSGGLARTYQLFDPPTIGSARPALVIALHGAGGDGVGMAQLSHLDLVARTAGFLVVYPDGIGGVWSDGRRPQSREADDVGFASDLIDQLERRYRIDPKRVFVTGISNGGFMSIRLACDLSDRVAAIAPVAAGFPTNVAAACQLSRPVSVLEIQGTEDPLVPFGGGAVGGPNGGTVLSAEASAATWAGLDGCGSPQFAPIMTGSAGATTAIRGTTYDGCRQASEVQLLAVHGGGHTWPGGEQYLPEKLIGRTSDLIDGSQEIWEFFQEHPMP
jgi:polyhydroxybutyrate depolymerase